MDLLLLGTAAAFGLAASAGLNTTVPLLIVGLLARSGLLVLSAPFDVLTGDVALAGLALLAIIEVMGDFVPGIDSVLHLLQWPMAAAAGAVLFASQTSVVSWVSPELAIIVGILTAGGVHGARAAARPIVTIFAPGIGNLAVSTLENGAAGLLVAGSLFAPFLSALLVILLIALILVGTAWALGHIW
jgi:hypothetical protein